MVLKRNQRQNKSDTFHDSTHDPWLVSDPWQKYNSVTRDSSFQTPPKSRTFKPKLSYDRNFVPSKNGKYPFSIFNDCIVPTQDYEKNNVEKWNYERSDDGTFSYKDSPKCTTSAKESKDCSEAAYGPSPKTFPQTVTDMVGRIERLEDHIKDLQKNWISSEQTKAFYKNMISETFHTTGTSANNVVFDGRANEESSSLNSPENGTDDNSSVHSGSGDHRHSFGVNVVIICDDGLSTTKQNCCETEVDIKCHGQNGDRGVRETTSDEYNRECLLKSWSGLQKPDGAYEIARGQPGPLNPLFWKSPVECHSVPLYFRLCSTTGDRYFCMPADPSLTGALVYRSFSEFLGVPEDKFRVLAPHGNGHSTIVFNGNSGISGYPHRSLEIKLNEPA